MLEWPGTRVCLQGLTWHQGMLARSDLALNACMAWLKDMLGYLHGMAPGYACMACHGTRCLCVLTWHQILVRPDLAPDTCAF